MQITEHPLYPVPTQAQFTADKEACIKYLIERERRIAQEGKDPYYYGHEPDIWKKTDKLWAKNKEVLMLGGNRAGKTEYAAKLAIRKMLEKPGARIWCFQTNDSNSVEMQQPAVFKHVPSEYRQGQKKKDKVFNLSYSQKNGFSEGTFIFPNSSQCFFRHYSQDIKSIEGGEVDFAWCDELVPEEWLETIRFRLVTRGGILLVTFTPIEGYTPTVKRYMQGCKTLESVPAPLLGGAPVPRLQQPTRINSKVIYFHTSDNPFGGYENLKKTLEGASRSEILCRAYGVPTRAVVARFPKFNDKIHVLPASKIPQEGTRYQIIDPCAGRNWFMAWAIVDERERMYFYREWPSPGQYIPSIGDPGDWAEPHGKLHDGAQGPAQKGFGWGLKRYKEEIERLEKISDEENEIIEYRQMDSRYANSTTISKDSATTLIEECADIGLVFSASPADSIDEGVQLINSQLDYNEKEEISYTNEPLLYFSDACPNMIFAMKEWTGEDGKTGATKDPIDVIRYAVLSRLCYIDEEAYATKPNSYGII
jgi:phage terminase large subunit-like protein